MPLPRRKRRRTSTGGRWTDAERSRLWKVKNQNRKLPWEVIKASDFPNRSVFALQKQYSMIKLDGEMDLKRTGGNPTGSRLGKESSTTIASQLGKRPSASDEAPANKPAQKQRRISDSEEYSDSEDTSDEETGDETAGDYQHDGTRTRQRLPRAAANYNLSPQSNNMSATGKPSLVAKLRIPQSGRGNGSAAVNRSREYPLPPPDKTISPQRSLLSNNDQQTSPRQSPTQFFNKYDHPSMDRELSHASDSKSDLEGQYGNLKRSAIYIFKQVVSALESDVSNMQMRQEVNRQVERLKGDLSSERKETSHLRELLEKLQKELSSEKQETSRLSELLKGKEQAETEQSAKLHQLQIDLQTQTVKIGQLELELQDEKVQNTKDMPLKQECDECSLKEQRLAAKDQQIAALTVQCQFIQKLRRDMETMSKSGALAGSRSD